MSYSARRLAQLNVSITDLCALCPTYVSHNVVWLLEKLRFDYAQALIGEGC